MSVTLLIKLKHPMPLDEIGAASTAALRELLNLGHDLTVTVGFDEVDRVNGAADGVVTEKSNRVVCSLLEHDERVTVTPFTVPVQVAVNDDSYSFVDQNYLSVEWQFKKTPLSWALVAAVATGVAKTQDSEMEDNSGFFTRTNVQTPDEFCRTLRLASPQTDVELAAVALYSKMTKSVEIAEWLESQ